MAQQLKKSDDEVVLITMFIIYNLQHRPGKTPLFLKVIHKIQDMSFQIVNLLTNGSVSRYKYYKVKSTVELSRIKVKKSILNAGIIKIFSLDGD